SSFVPLQSSSSPLHTSCAGPVPPVHVSVVPWHTFVPVVQMPTPQLPLAQHEVFRPGTSSTLPLQSSSTPLHTSALGPTAPMHCTVPPEHCKVPALQGALLQLPLGQHD